MITRTNTIIDIALGMMRVGGAGISKPTSHAATVLLVTAGGVTAGIKLATL